MSHTFEYDECFRSDLENFEETFTDPALRKKLIDIFLDEFPKKLSELSESFSNGDIKRFVFLTHFVKGMLGNMRFLSLSEDLRKINEIANGGIFPKSEEFEEIMLKLNSLLKHLYDISYHHLLKN